MAILGWTSGCSHKSRVETCMWAVQLLLLLVGVVSTVLVFKGAVTSCSLDIIFSALSTLWISIKVWLSPPYIYIVLNFVIISIAASSTFYHPNKLVQDADHCSNLGSIPSSPPPEKEPVLSSREDSIAEDAVPPDDIRSRQIENPDSSRIDDSISTASESDREISSDTRAAETGESCNRPPESADVESATANSEEEDTMDATWKAIMEGGRPRGAQLKKSRTWNESRGGGGGGEEAAASAGWKELRKSETVRERVTMTRKGGLRRDQPMSHEELNRRAEAFIRKFNHDIRLQRQEFDQRFLDMISRGL